MGILSRAKDRLIEQMGLAYLNGHLLVPYGRATRLRIDSHLNTISIDAQLNGETAPIRIDLIDYEVTKKGGNYFAEVREIQTSREWLSKLAAKELVPIKLKLPPALGRLLFHAL